MVVGSLVGAVIGIALGTLVNGILIWTIGKLRLGMEVEKVSAAFLAGLIVAAGGVFAGWLYTLFGSAPTGGLAGAIIRLIVAAGVLRAIGEALPGLRVKGWGGAFVAALAIAALGWLLSLVVGAQISS
jgi:uncharacterized membrane protein YvlD (DUF360 family)